MADHRPKPPDYVARAIEYPARTFCLTCREPLTLVYRDGSKVAPHYRHASTPARRVRKLSDLIDVVEESRRGRSTP